MAKILMVDPKKCVSCRMCEVACSFNKYKTCSPNRARIHAIAFEREGFSIPVVCLQCDDAACANVCPNEAIARDPKTGAYVVDYNRCIGCKLCVLACPFGNMTYDKIGGQVIKCDLCEGSPQCVAACPYGALTYKEESSATLNKKKETAEKFKTLFGEVG